MMIRFQRSAIDAEGQSTSTSLVRRQGFTLLCLDLGSALLEGDVAQALASVEEQHQRATGLLGLRAGQPVVLGAVDGAAIDLEHDVAWPNPSIERQAADLDPHHQDAGDRLEP